jgi:hypothetical protein
MLDIIQWQAFVKSVTKRRIPQKAKNFLTRRENISFQKWRCNDTYDGPHKIHPCCPWNSKVSKPPVSWCYLATEMRRHVVTKGQATHYLGNDAAAGLITQNETRVQCTANVQCVRAGVQGHVIGYYKKRSEETAMLLQSQYFSSRRGGRGGIIAQHGLE